jgi:GH24 family phage-related lysozyme (muramidase)
MPEQEELKLVVTLDDQASAKLASLTEQLSKLGGGGGSGAYDQMGKAMEQMAGHASKASGGIKGLASEMVFATAKGTFFGNVLAKGAEEAFKLGKQILERATDLNKLTLEINATTIAAERMGSTTAALENNLRAFRTGGLSIEAATKNVAGFSDAIADLSLVNGQLRGQLLSGGFLEIPKMFDVMNRVDASKTVKEKLNVVKAAMDEVRERWTKLAGPEEGARMARQFREMFNVPDLDQFIARAREVTATERELGDEREANAKKYQEHLADQQTGIDRIEKAIGGVILRYEEWLGVMEKIGNIENEVARVVEGLAAGKGTPEAAKSAIQDKFGKFGLGLPAPAAAPAAATTGQVEPQKFFGGAVSGTSGSWDSSGFARSGNAFWQNLKGRGDVGIEDRRNLEDNTEQTKSLTDEIRTLNDNLTNPLPGRGGAALGSMAAALGYNDIGRGGGGGGGPMFRPGIGPGRGGGNGGPMFRPGIGPGRGGDTTTSAGSPAKMNDERGTPVDPETMKEAEQLGRAGDVGGLQKLFASKGYHMSGPACGIVASKYAKSAGFKPPEGGAVATNWRKWGVEGTAEDINKEGHPFGSVVGTYKHRRYGGNVGGELPTGATGGHVMEAVPGTYDPKTNTAMFADQYGVRRRSLSDVELRYAGDPAVAEAAKRREGPAAAAALASPDAAKVGDQGGDNASILADASKWVRSKESFKGTAFPDFGETSIGYGTKAGGRTSITEPEARKEEEEYLAGSLKRIDALNPNLPRNQKIALASLDFNTGWTTRSGEKNEALRAALKGGDTAKARELFGTYVHVGGPHGKVLPGLASRRAEELKMWDDPNFFGKRPPAAAAAAAARSGGSSMVDFAAARKRAGIMQDTKPPVMSQDTKPPVMSDAEWETRKAKALALTAQHMDITETTGAQDQRTREAWRQYHEKQLSDGKTDEEIIAGLRAGRRATEEELSPKSGQKFNTVTGEPVGRPISYRALDGKPLDRDSREVTVTGKGQLNVNVNGPPGTRASASGEGLLKNTKVQQETQMTPASKGYTGDGSANTAGPG